MNITLRKGGIALFPNSQEDIDKLEKLSDAIYEVDIKNLDMRTVKQNAALHKLFSLIADEFNDKELSVPQVLKADVPFSMDAVKEYIWRPIQKVVTSKSSSTKLTKKEIDDVYEVVNKLLGEKFGIHVPFPNKELWNDG